MPSTEENGEPMAGDRVKIKQEKVTPPATPNRVPSSSAAGLNITDDLLDNILNDRKPAAEPIKSSNEILADLFKVFNAAPPTLDDNSTDSTTAKKKKHKKEKKVKKEKKDKKERKRSRTNSENNSEDSEKSKGHKVKKAKKHDSDGDHVKKRHKKSKEPEIKSEQLEVVIKREKVDEAKKTTVRLETASKSHDGNAAGAAASKQSRPNDEKNPPMNIQVSLTKDNDGAISKRKIVIKSLVDSTVYQDTMKEVDAKQKEKEREKLKEKEKSKERTRDREKRKHTKHRSKSIDKERSRNNRSRSSSLSLSDEETYLREKEREREHERHRDRDKDRDREKERDRENHRDRDRDRDKVRDDFYGDYRREVDKDFERRRHRSRNDLYRHDHDRRRSRSSSRHRHERSEDRIDKKRLLEIARKNAITMLKNGTLPGTLNMDPEAKERALTKMRYGGKSVDELTEFCKKLSKGEAASGYLSNISGESDIDADLEKPFHHPFVIKDRGPIVMNIKNSTPIPPKTAEQTKAILMQFPVSSGQHHRLNESEWVPVEPQKPSKEDKKVTEKSTDASSTSAAASSKSKATDEIPLPTTDYGYQTTIFTDPPAPVFTAPPSIIEPMPISVPAPVPAPVPVPTPIPPPPIPPSTDNIFATLDTGTSKDLDVTSIITKRLNAMRKLQDNPLDSEAIKLMYRTQKDMSAWASSKFVPGQFTGSTGASILSTKELASGFQAWAKRDQLISTTPVSGGMGMHLLQKMGWKPGEGLGKEKNGSLQPLLLEVKLDKKGLVAEEENPQAQRQKAQAARKAKATTLQMAKQNFESKHPVSLLGELSAKRKFGAPLYELVLQEGPSHQRQFLYSVTINGQIYQPNVTSLNKKEAKAAAAKYALQKMGFISEPVAAQPQQQPVPTQPMQAPQPFMHNNMHQIASSNAF